MINVEAQRSNNDNHLMRARYNKSCVTANITDPGEKFENVPTVCFVYISEFIQKNFEDPDFPKLSQAIYYYKHTAGDIKKMCTILDEYTEDRLREKEIKNAKELFANGLPVSKVKNIRTFIRRRVE